MFLCIFCIVPSPPTSLILIERSSTSLMFEWESPLLPHGIIEYYLVTYRGVETLNQVDDSFSSLKEKVANGKSMELKGLEPYSEYEVRVQASNGHALSAGRMTAGRTLEDSTLIFIFKSPALTDFVFLTYSTNSSS